VKLFGTSGIRGLVNKDVDAKLAMAVGNSVGSLYNDLILGYDTRASNIMLSNAIASGALLSGASIHIAGLVPTPTLAVTTSKFNCGIMVTASHNPPEYNGIKLWNPDGAAFDTSQMEKVESAILKSKIKTVNWKDIKSLRYYNGAIREHIDKILDSVERSDIKVVVDCQNGAASVVTPYLLKRLGCEVVALNSNPDGFFHGKTPEPTEENLKVLMKTVRSTGAQLGIAHDGDGDRVVAVDEKGNYVGGDKLLSLFCNIEAVKNIVVPFDASMTIENSLRHVNVHRCRVGDVYVAEMIKRTSADFGGEPSGTYIFPRHSMCPDAVYAAARLVEIVKRDKLSKLIGKLPSYPLITKSISYNASKREKIFANITKTLEGVKSRKLEKLDGTKLLFDDSWALIRFSGTEPKVRITVEAKSSKKAKEIYDKVHGAVKRGMRKAG
jgi:phosphoglucosamine mutase